MKPVSISALFTLLALAPLHAVESRPIRVLVWDEQQPVQKKTYEGKFLGEAIAAHLAALPGITVKNASLKDPGQGLEEAALDATDVLVWWSHERNAALTDDNAARVAARVREGRLGLLALHSTHWAKPFVQGPSLLFPARSRDVSGFPAGGNPPGD